MFFAVTTLLLQLQEQEFCSNKFNSTTTKTKTKNNQKTSRFCSCNLSSRRFAAAKVTGSVRASSLLYKFTPAKGKLSMQNAHLQLQAWTLKRQMFAASSLHLSVAVADALLSDSPGDSR